ncbi:MAG: LytTR family DNA-binding domain-containing protein [Prevotellaceae bacterium]|nr:LytTR family DNA-binding domain-containing protein [Prevotellaceae bacterium]
MKLIPSQLIKDSCLSMVAYMMLILALHPVYFGEYRITETIIRLTTIQAAVSCVIIIICTAIVSKITHKPFSYADSLSVRCRQFLYISLLCVPIMTIFLLFCNPIVLYGFDHLDYAFLDHDGTFTLKWLYACLAACITGDLVVCIVLITISEIRHKNLMMKELEDINNALALGHEAKVKEESDHVEMITLKGDSRESLTVNPNDIVYIESIANYLNIIYYNDSDICQKRLRSSLRDIEEMLSQHPFFVHIHRAFLVNINFITQVTGNAAGYKLQIFGTEKILPVSKSNVALFKSKIGSEE